MAAAAARKVTYFEPVRAGLARNTIIESTFGSPPLQCTMRIDCGSSTRRGDRPVPANGGRVCPSVLTKRSFADWHAGRNAVYQLRRTDHRRAPRGRRRVSRA